MSGYNEGSLKWATISRNQRPEHHLQPHARTQLMNTDCSLSPVVIVPVRPQGRDAHHGGGLPQEVSSPLDHNSDSIRFVPAAGNAGIEAATNQEIERSRRCACCTWCTAPWRAGLVSFGSLRAVLCILCPLALTSVLCQALMAVARHRCEGGHAAGHRAGRRGRCGLRHLCVCPPEVPLPAQAACPARPPIYHTLSTHRQGGGVSPASRSPSGSPPGSGRPSSSRPTWASCSPSCSCGTWWER